MSDHKYTTLEELRAEHMKDPEFRKEDRKIAPYYEFCVKIITRRLAKKMSQQDLAGAAGVPLRHIRLMEDGDGNFKLDEYIKVAEALGCRLHITLEDEE